MLTARKLVQRSIEMSLRGVLRGFGLKVGKVAPARFEARIKELSNKILRVTCAKFNNQIRIARIERDSVCGQAWTDLGVGTCQ
jgi:hypothetical protein